MLSLHTKKTHIPNPQKALSLKSLFKRASLFSSFSLKGSMALEGSLVLPIFLFYMVTVLYCLEIVRFQSDVFEAMHQTAGKVWLSAYEHIQTDERESCIMPRRTVEEAEENIVNYLSRQKQPFLCVEEKENGVKIQAIPDDKGKGNLSMEVSYQVQNFIDWLPIGEVCVRDHIFVHGFVGYTGASVGIESENGIYVYITPSGTKYHTMESCTYLKVKLQTVKTEELGKLRNSSGEIYKPCEVCKPTGVGVCFYTKWGNKYHINSDCSALKRTVYLIPLSDVGSRTACSKCG